MRRPFLLLLLLFCFILSNIYLVGERKAHYNYISWAVVKGSTFNMVTQEPPQKAETCI